MSCCSICRHHNKRKLREKRRSLRSRTTMMKASFMNDESHEGNESPTHEPDRSDSANMDFTVTADAEGTQGLQRGIWGCSGTPPPAGFYWDTVKKQSVSTDCKRFPWRGVWSRGRKELWFCLGAFQLMPNLKNWAKSFWKGKAVGSGSNPALPTRDLARASLAPSATLLQHMNWRSISQKETLSIPGAHCSFEHHCGVSQSCREAQRSCVGQHKLLQISASLWFTPSSPHVRRMRRSETP